MSGKHPHTHTRVSSRARLHAARPGLYTKYPSISTHLYYLNLPYAPHSIYRSSYPALSCPASAGLPQGYLQKPRLGDDVLLIASRHHVLMPHMSLCQDVYALDSTPALDPGCMLLPLAALHVLLLCMRCNFRVAKSMVIPAASP